jgi:hypothetical protein
MVCHAAARDEIKELALVGFQGRGFVDGIPHDFGHSLLFEALVFQQA